jgi:hypothetical protein
MLTYARPVGRNCCCEEVDYKEEGIRVWKKLHVIIYCSPKVYVAGMGELKK